MRLSLIFTITFSAASLFCATPLFAQELPTASIYGLTSVEAGNGMLLFSYAAQSLNGRRFDRYGPSVGYCWQSGFSMDGSIYLHHYNYRMDQAEFGAGAHFSMGYADTMIRLQLSDDPASYAAFGFYVKPRLYGLWAPSQEKMQTAYGGDAGLLLEGAVNALWDQLELQSQLSCGIRSRRYLLFGNSADSFHEQLEPWALHLSLLFVLNWDEENPIPLVFGGNYYFDLENSSTIATMTFGLGY